MRNLSNDNSALLEHDPDLQVALNRLREKFAGILRLTVQNLVNQDIKDVDAVELVEDKILRAEDEDLKEILLEFKRDISSHLVSRADFDLVLSPMRSEVFDKDILNYDIYKDSTNEEFLNMNGIKDVYKFVDEKN